MAKLGRSDSVSESLREIVHVYFTITFFSWVSLEVVLSCVRLFVTPWTVALQAPLSMGIPRQEYWSGLPLPSPGPTLGGQKPKGRNNSNLKPGKRKSQTQ